MKLKITQDFAFAHRGYERREYVTGEVVDAEDEELIKVSIEQGWAVPADQEGARSQTEGAPPPAPEGKAKKGAPENKAKG